MVARRLTLESILCMAFALALPGVANGDLVQLQFGNIDLGSETTTLVSNGGFEANDGNGTAPTGWLPFGGPIYVTNENVGGLIPNYDSGDYVVAANVTPFMINGGIFQSVTLAPNTEYVLSAYMWNLSDPDPNAPGRQWNINVDLNDVTNDPQLGVLGGDPNGDGGYFVYNTFNTAETGTNLTLRVFFDSPGGLTTDWPYQPVGALWDRISITEASSFVAPSFSVPEPSGIAVCLLLGMGAIRRSRTTIRR